VFVCHISIDEWFVFVGIRKCGRITEKQAFMITTPQLSMLERMTSNAGFQEQELAPQLWRGRVNLLWRHSVCNEQEEYCVTLLTSSSLERGVSASWWHGLHSAW